MITPTPVQTEARKNVKSIVDKMKNKANTTLSELFNNTK